MKKALFAVGVVVLAALLMFRVVSRWPSDDAQPRFTRADLPPLPEQNAFPAFSAIAAKVSRPAFDRSVLESPSWAALKERKENGLNADFDRALWTQADALDAVLKISGFTETCEPGPCDLMPVFYATEALMMRVLVLANRGELVKQRRRCCASERCSSRGRLRHARCWAW